jgi:membrane associated rhomboid family serine protease
MPDSWDFANNKPERPAPPIMTFALVALCVVVTLANWYSGENHNNPWYVLGHLGSFDAPYIWSGHYAPLLTSVFLHLSIFHLLFNMIWLARLGPVMEETMNPLAYSLFIVTSAVIGSAAELAWSGQTGSGMSGVVYAMAGLMWAGRSTIVAWRPVMTRYLLNTFLIWGGFCVIATWTGTLPVANAAHFGGLLYGFAVGFLFYSQRKKPLWGVVLAALVAMTIASVTWMPWSARWTSWKGERAQAKRDYPAAIAWYERSMRQDLNGIFALSRISECWRLMSLDAAARKDRTAQERATHEQAAAFNRMIALGANLPARKIEEDDAPTGSPLDAVRKVGGPRAGE